MTIRRLLWSWSGTKRRRLRCSRLRKRNIRIRCVAIREICGSYQLWQENEETSVPYWKSSIKIMPWKRPSSTAFLYHDWVIDLYILKILNAVLYWWGRRENRCNMIKQTSKTARAESCSMGACPRNLRRKYQHWKIKWTGIWSLQNVSELDGGWAIRRWRESQVLAENPAFFYDAARCPESLT